MTAKTSKQVVTTVFFALILDLLAFTIPLPLFPRLIAWYLHREAHSPSTILARLLHYSSAWRSSLLSLSGSSTSKGSETGDETRWMWTGGAEGGDKNWDVVLLGGAMGSLFSLCQCLISPWLGSLSDKYGRKRVLLATMLGNILSAIVWARSTIFSSFLLSRLIGGLSEGNVQLSTAIISDVTEASNRSKSLALVGIAFSICFTLGPSLGAYFASRPLPLALSSGHESQWNVYALPAAISLGLLVAETLYLALKLPETRFWKTETSTESKRNGGVQESAHARENRLRHIGWLHGAFLLFFSGAEFTLTFLTYDLFAATNSQNGRLLSYIGVLAALIQGRYVRPSLARVGEMKVAGDGCVASVFAFAFLAALSTESGRSSYTISTVLLYAGATALAFTSATVVTSLTAAAAACCDADENVDPGTDADGSVKTGSMASPLQRGRALGIVRSKGQMGRAIGPMLATSIYWIAGPLVCYCFLAFCMMQVAIQVMGLRDKDRRKLKAKKAS